MPYGYGSANRRGPSGPPGGGATSRGSGRDFSPRPRAPTVTTGGPPSIISRPTPPTVTTGGPPSILSRPTPPTTPPPVTRGGGPPGGGGGGGPSPGITHPFLRNKMIKKAIAKKRRMPTWKDWALSNINPWQLDDTYGEGAGSTLGARGITKGLKDYMFGKGITDLQNLPADAKVWMAHGPKPDDYAKIAKEGFSSVRPASKLTNLISPRAWEQIAQGKNPLASTGVYTAVGKTKKEALEAAGRFAKGPLTRGVGATGDLSKVFTAQVPRSNFPISSGALRTTQMEVPASFANKYFGIGDKGAKLGATPAKGMIKSTVGRMLPGVGAALGGASALKHLQAGNYGQAAMAGLSMVPGPIGYAGLGGELLLGALQNAKQIPNWQATQTVGRNYARGGLADLYRYGGFIG